jgi:Zn-dependent peptidase ImmA (M78 family)
MEVEERGGADPARLAAAIHLQLGGSHGPVPIKDIARALDIVDIYEQPLRNLEGALITTAERDVGSILVNAKSSSQRRRYSIAHELLHFLNPLHRQTVEGRFECRSSDTTLGGSPSRADLTVHQRQEIEANRFSIELLAPKARLKPHIRGLADIANILAVADELDISKQAAARRYVELHPEPLAVVFGRNNSIQYHDWNDRFPVLLFRSGDNLPELSPSREVVSTMDEVEAALWLKWPGKRRLYAQTHLQSDGYSITLLLAERHLDDDVETQPQFRRRKPSAPKP